MDNKIITKEKGVDLSVDPNDMKLDKEASIDFKKLFIAIQKRFAKTDLDENTLGELAMQGYSKGVEAFEEADDIPEEEYNSFVFSYMVDAVRGHYKNNGGKGKKKERDPASYLTEEEKNKIANENMKFIYFVAQKFRTTGIDEDELFSLGLVGFAKALKTFNKETGSKFSTYSFTCMKHEILFYKRKFTKIQENDVSMNKPIATDSKTGSALELGQTLRDIDFGVKTVETSVVDNEVVRILYEIIDTLDWNDKYIMIHRFGLYNQQKMTQRQIADEINMSQANVSKLEKTISDKIKKIMNSKYKITSIDI